MANPKITQLAGDIRMWLLAGDFTRTPVIPESADPDGNQPIETDAMNFGYEEGDTVAVVSKRRGTKYGQTIFSQTQPGQTAISLTLLEIPPPIFARMMFGDAANADVTAGSVTDEPFEVTAKGSPIFLPHRYLNPTPTPVVKSGSTTLVAGTDYTIDTRRGAIVVKAAAVDVGDDILVSYSYLAVTSTKILGGVRPTQDFYITGDMEDRNSSDQGLLEVFQARLTAEADIDWLSSEPINPVLTGNLLVPNHAPAPYTFELYKQAV